jgi:hypothetical protein
MKERPKYCLLAMQGKRGRASTGLFVMCEKEKRPRTARLYSRTKGAVPVLPVCNVQDGGGATNCLLVQQERGGWPSTAWEG